MSTVSLHLPEDLTEQAERQAAAAGISLDQYVAAVLAARLGAQAETERYLAARAKRAIPGRAKEILARAGLRNPPRPDDLLDDEP